jgi:outer membrane protein assembly factor BamD
MLTGCGSEPKDDLSGTTAEKLYRDAKDDIESGAYDRATKALERVEGLAAGTLLAQQAQLLRQDYDLAHARLDALAVERQAALHAWRDSPKAFKRSQVVSSSFTALLAIA